MQKVRSAYQRQGHAAICAKWSDCDHNNKDTNTKNEFAAWKGAQQDTVCRLHKVSKFKIQTLNMPPSTYLPLKEKKPVQKKKKRKKKKKIKKKKKPFLGHKWKCI